MRKKLVIILLCLLGAFLLASGGGLWWASRYLRSPEFRTEFGRLLERATGREVAFEGELEVSVFPWLGLAAHGFRLGNDPDFGPTPMLAARQLSAHIKVLPLLRHRLVFDTVELEGAELALTLNPEGRANWDSLVERLRAEENATEESGGQFRQVTVRGLRLTGAKARLDDLKHGFTFIVTDTSLRTGRIEAGRPMPFTLACAFDWPEPGLVARLEATGRLNWGGPPGAPLFEETTAKGEIGGTFMPKGAPMAAIATGIGMDPQNRDLLLTDARLKVLGVDWSGSVSFFEVTEHFRMEARLAAQRFAPRQVVNAYWPGSIAAEHKDALHSAEGRLDLDGNEDELVFSSPGFLLDGAKLRGKLRMGFGDRPGLDFELAADRLDADAYVAAFTSNSTSPPLAVASLPMRYLTRVVGKGSLKAENLKLAGVPIQGAELLWQASDGQHRAQLKPARAQGGTVSADLSASFSGGPGDPKDPEAKAAPVVLGYAGNLLLDGVDARQVSWVNRPGLTTSGRLTLRAHAEAAKAAAAGQLLLGQVVRRAAGGLEARMGPATLEWAADKSQPKAQPRRMTFSSLQAQARFAPLSGQPGAPAQPGDWTVQADGQLSAVGIKPQLSFEAKAGGVLRSGERGGTALTAATATARLKGWFLPRAENEASISLRGGLDFPSQTLTAGSFTAQVWGLPVSGSLTGTKVLGGDIALAGRVRCQDGDPRRLLAALEIRAPKSADKRALSKLSGDADLSLSAKGLWLSNLTGQLDDVPVRGSYALQGFDPPRQVFALSAGILDLDRYLPAPEPLRRGASVERPAPEPLPVESLRELSAEGTLAFRSLKWHGLTTRDLKLALKADGGQLTVKPITGSFYGGALTGEFTAQAAQNEVQARLSLAAKDFQAGPMMIGWAGKEYVTGRTDMFLDVGGAGTTDTELLRSLDGMAEFRITDGSYALSGAADAQTVRTQIQHRPQGSSVAQAIQARRPGTPFRTAGARLKVHKGWFASDDFRLDGPSIQVTGKGRFSVAEDAIGVNLTANMPGVPDVPIRVYGRLKDPEMEIPAGAFINNTIKEILGLPFKPIKFFKDLLF